MFHFLIILFTLYIIIQKWNTRVPVRTSKYLSYVMLECYLYNFTCRSSGSNFLIKILVVLYSIFGLIRCSGHMFSIKFVFCILFYCEILSAGSINLNHTTDIRTWQICPTVHIMRTACFVCNWMVSSLFGVFNARSFLCPHLLYQVSHIIIIINIYYYLAWILLVWSIMTKTNTEQNSYVIIE